MNSKESIIIFVAGVLMAGAAAGAYFYMTQELHRVPASSLAVLPKSTSQAAPANTNSSSGSTSFGGVTKPAAPAQSLEEKLAALKQSTGGSSAAAPISTPAAASPTAATPTTSKPASNSDVPMVIPSESVILAARAAAPVAATNMYAEAVANSPKLSTTDAAALNAFVNDTDGDEAIQKKAVAVMNKYVVTLKKFDTFAKKSALACSTWAVPHVCDTAALVRLAMLQQVRVAALVDAQKIPQAIDLATLIYSMGDKLEENSDSVATYDAALEIRKQGLGAFSYIDANDKTTEDQRTAFRKLISSSLPEKTWNKRAIQNDMVNLGVIALRAIDAGSAATSTKYVTKAQGALVTSYTARKKAALTAKNENAWDAFETFKELYETNADYSKTIDAPCPNATITSTGIARTDVSSSSPNWLGSAFVTSWKSLFPAAAGLNEKRCEVEKMAGEI